LERIPEVLEAHGITGAGDVLCRVAAKSHEHLQDVLLVVNRVTDVVRSNSVIVLSNVVSPRVLPLLESDERAHPTRVRPRPLLESDERAHPTRVRPRADGGL
jgi:hypothetical protein